VEAEKYAPSLELAFRIAHVLGERQEPTLRLTAIIPALCLRIMLKSRFRLAVSAIRTCP
jgi:DNA-binding XRE family transcriptional regulator